MTFATSMKPAIILLAILVIGGAIVWLIDRLFYARKAQEDGATATDEAEEQPAQQGCVDESCGIRSICPSEQILAGECKPQVTYYDDEELDRFAGRGDEDYTAEEEEQWRDVLYTLLPGDLIGWGQSIKHRGLTMPAAIRDEFLQLAAEHRAPHGQ